MADPAPETESNPIADIVSAVTGVGVGARRLDVSDARYMLALLKPREGGADEDFESGTKALYQRWFNEHANRMPNEVMRGSPPGASVRDVMANDIIAQMTVLNGGKEISESAQDQIRGLLLENDADGFVQTIMEHRVEALAYARERTLAMKEDPPRDIGAFDGIIGILFNENPALANVDVGNVDISPIEIARGNEHSVFKNIFRLNGLGNGADTTLAMIEGTPRENWGAYNEDTGHYANLMAYAGPVGDEAQKEFWGGAEGYRITRILEDRGVVSFSNDGARDAWVKEMSEAFTGNDPVRSARDLTERMREFAQGSSAITMESEVIQEQDSSLASRMVNAQEGRFLAFSDSEAQQAFTVELERLLIEHGDGGEYANLNFDEIDDLTADFVAEYNTSHPTESGEPAIVVNHDAIDARKANFDAVNAERVSASVPDVVSDDRAEVDDPVSAEGARTYLAGASGVGRIMEADHQETMQMAAVHEVGNELRAGNTPGIQPEAIAPVVDNNYGMA